MLVKKERKTHDFPIERAEGKSSNWKNRLKDGSPQRVRDEVKRLADLYSAASKKLKLGCHYVADIDNVHDMALATSPGFECWLNTRKIIATPVSAEQALRVVKCHQETLYGGGWEKSIINCIKGTKSGKTKDIQHASLMICAYHTAKNGMFSRPLFLLTARKDGEEQLKEQWEMLRDFFFHIKLIGEPGWANPCFPLSNVLNTVKLERDLIRRTSGQNGANFEKAIEYALDNDIHLILNNDEADEGMKEGQIQDRWMTQKIVPLLKNRSGSIVQLNWTATPEAYSETDYQHSVNLTLATDDNYLPLEQVPKITIDNFTSELGLGITKLGNTCSVRNHPYCSPSDYVKTWYKDDLDKISSKKGKEDFICDIMNGSDFLKRWEYYKNKYVPTILSEIFDKSMQINKKNGVKIVGTSLPFRVMGLRFINKNNVSYELVEKLRKKIPLEKGIVLPFFGVKDNFCGHTVNWQKECVQPENAIKKAFEYSGIEYGSVPVLIVLTNSARRTTEMPKNYIHLDFTRAASSMASLIQNFGRTSGYDPNSLIVWTTGNHEIYNSVDLKIQLHPSLMGGKVVERERIWLMLEDDKHIQYPKIKELFSRVEKEYLNRSWMLDNLKQGSKIQGGRSGFVQSHSKGEPQTPINDIITEEFLDYLSEESTIFKDKNLKEKPVFLTMTQKSFTSEGYDMLIGQIPSRTKENSDKLDDYCMKQCFTRGKLYAFAGIRTAELSGFVQDREKDITLNGKNRGRFQVQISYRYNTEENKMEVKTIALRLCKPAIEHTYDELAPKPGHMNHHLAGEKDFERFKEMPHYVLQIEKRGMKV